MWKTLRQFHFNHFIFSQINKLSHRLYTLPPIDTDFCMLNCADGLTSHSHTPFQPIVVSLWLAGLQNAVLLNVLWLAGAYASTGGWKLGRSMVGSLTLYSSSTSYVEYQSGGGKGLVDLVNQLTLERCHSFWFYGSCRKRIPIRDRSMPKRILSQCGVSSKMFIGLIVPTTCSSVRWD